MSSRRRWTPAAFAGGQPEAVLAFDIETSVDRTLLPSDWGDRFPKPLWHQVQAISMVEASIVRDDEGSEIWEVEAVRSGGLPGWSEARLLAGFWDHLQSRPWRLVSWNGARFDLPAILARSLIHGLDAGVLWRRGNKWENYLQYRTPIWHLDVMQALSANGAAPAHGLDETAQALGWPGKSGEHGSLVEDMIAQGDLIRVRRYCETDAAQTAAVALDWMRLSGGMSAAGYRRSLDSLLTVLAGDPDGSPHLSALAAHKRSQARTSSPENMRHCANSQSKDRGLNPCVNDRGPRRETA